MGRSRPAFASDSGAISETVVAEMASEKVAENCLILELGFSLRATEFASEGRRTARFRAWS